MKTLVSIMLMLSCIVMGMSQNVDWLNNTTSSNTFSSQSVHASTHLNDHFFLAGDFWKDIIFDNFSIEIADEISDAYISKLNTDGETIDLWHFKSSNYARINAIEVLPNSNDLIIVGQFRNDLTYQNTTITSPHFSSGYVMRISEGGEMKWIKQIETIEGGFASCEALAISQDGEIYSGFEIFRGVNFENISFVQPGETVGALILKFNAEGTLQDHQYWEGQGFENLLDITQMEVDLDGNLITTGAFSNTMIIDNQPISNSNSNAHAFIIQQNSSLDINWTKTFNSQTSSATCTYLDANSLVVNVSYNGFLEIDDIQYMGSGSSDFAVYKMNQDGQIKWSRNFVMDTSNWQSGASVRSIVKFNNSYHLGGFYKGFFLDEAGNTILSNNAFGDFQFPFIIALEKDLGTLTDVYNFDGSNEPGILGTMTAIENQLFFSGEFSGVIQFDDFNVTTVNSSVFFGALKNIEIHVESSKEETIKIYPNLVNDELVIESSIPYNKFLIYNQIGQLIEVENFEQNVQTLSLQYLSSGTYYINIISESGPIVKKFVKI